MTTDAASGQTALGRSAGTSLPYRYAPRPAGGPTVVRKELLRNLTEATLLKQLSVIRGPAGSGKTTLLTQWRGICEDMGRAVVWLTVDKADHDPARFLDGLASAIAIAGCEGIARAFRAQGSDQAPIIAAQQLAALCNDAHARLALAIDQFEEIEGGAVGAFLNAFLNHALNVRLVIASRRRLAFPLGALRARDQIFEIGPSDLNLTPMETHALFPGVPELYTRRLHCDTSGEPVALAFARRAMENGSRDVIGAESWHDLLNEYYRAEVLDSLPPEIREAMARLVVVERFDLSLATALVGRNAANLIERLHVVDGLLLRHRGTREFYFSEMLRRFLETRLAWLADDEHRALHRRAAAWFTERGRHAEALRHAIAAHDRDHAVQLLDRVGYATLVVHHGVIAAHELLEAVGVMPEDAPIGQLLSLAVIHAHKGEFDKARRSLDEAKRACGQDAEIPSAIADQLALAEAIVAAFGDPMQGSDTAPALECYLAHAPANEHENRGLAQIFLSWACLCRGDMTGAEAYADAAELEYGESDAVYASIFLHIHRVLIWFWLNQLDRAVDEAVLASQMVRIFFPDDQRLRALTALLQASLLFEAGRPDPLTDMTELVGIVGALEAAPELQIWSHTQSVRAVLSQGAASEARGIIAHAIEIAERLGSQRMTWSLRLLSIEVSVRLDDRERAAAEAERLGIFDPAIFDRDALGALPFLTWQDRISAAFVAAAVAEARGDIATALRLVDIAQAEIDETSATRFRIQLEITRARLAQRRGDTEASNRHVATAQGLSKAGIPQALFLEPIERARLPEWSQGLARTPPPVHPDAGQRRPASEDRLTTRERQIMLLLGEGHQNKMVAHRLGLSEATVKFHLRNIYQKLNVQNRTQALARYLSLPDIRRD